MPSKNVEHPNWVVISMGVMSVETSALVTTLAGIDTVPNVRVRIEKIG
jgi:hypothetical protein